jgi:membrane-associated phospholipid phosphatase
MGRAERGRRVARRCSLIVACVAGFALVAAFASAGTATRFDQYALDHWMPGFSPSPVQQPEGFVSLYRPFGLHDAWWDKALGLWDYPGSVLISGLIFVIACVVLFRRDRARAAIIFVAAWLVGSGIEVICKDLLVRKPLYGTTAGGLRIHLRATDNSFPSGHVIRAILVVTVVLYLWPRLRSVALVWLAGVPPALVVSAAHVPTDVIGGGFVGLALVLGLLVALDLTGTASAPQSASPRKRAQAPLVTDPEMPSPRVRG